MNYNPESDIIPAVLVTLIMVIVFGFAVCFSIRDLADKIDKQNELLKYVILEMAEERGCGK